MKRRNFFMKVFKIFLSVFLILILLAGLFVFLIYNLMQSPSGDFKEYKLRVPSGMTYYSVSQDLEENGIIKNAKVFYYYSRYKQANLKSGVYVVNNKMSFDELHSLLKTGKQETISVSIPEGYTISAIAKILEERGVTSKNDFIKTATDRSFISEFGIPSTTLEGYIFPDTYYFTPNMSAKDVLEIMVENFYKKLSSIENAEALSAKELHDVVKLASIVEKEYKVASEAPLIASVFKNRLRHNIGLYSCATIIYIITEIQGRPHPDVVRYVDTEIDNRYNTYLYSGLTPTPISNPGLVALDAVINTPKTSYFFFRVDDEAKGTHVFTSDLESHIEAGF